MLSQKYIEHNNQTILWNTIKSIDLLNEIFGDNPNSENMKISWFKNIIETMYSSIPRNTGYDPSALNAKNKETIGYMIDNLKTMKNTKINKNMQPIQPAIQNQFIGKNAPTSIYSRNGTNRSDAFLANFSERQKEYETMIKKPTPPNENIFENKIEDTAISNMDELIKQHLKQREDELSMYALPAPPLSPVVPVLSNSENTGIQVLVNKSTTDSGEKKVIWATDVLNAINELKREIAEIKLIVLDIKNTPK